METLRAKYAYEVMAKTKIPDNLNEITELFNREEICAVLLDVVKNHPHFTCPNCGDTQDPYRFDSRPFVNRCRNCKADIRLTVGTVMEGSRLPMCVWFIGASVVINLPDVGAAGFQRAVGMTRYESALTMLRKLREHVAPLAQQETVTLLDLTRALAQKSPAS